MVQFESHIDCDIFRNMDMYAKQATWSPEQLEISGMPGDLRNNPEYTQSETYIATGAHSTMTLTLCVRCYA